MASSPTASLPPPEPYRPWGFLAWLFPRFFGHIAVEERWRSTVAEASSRGLVVHIMRSVSFLDFHCLDFLLKKFGLPAVRFVNDLGLWIFEPFGKGFRRLRLRRQMPEDAALAQSLKHGHGALLFVRRPPRVGETSHRGAALKTDLVKTLVETQRKLEQPILLLPQTFVWSKLPAQKRRSLIDLFFGPVEWPGRIRVFFQFLFNYRNALLRTGDPFDLRAFMQQNQDLTDAQIANKVRYALLRRMERERTIVLGPSTKAPSRIIEELLRGPRLRDRMQEVAREQRVPIETIRREARTEFRKLCAAQNPYWVSLVRAIVEWVWHRIYDGLQVDEAGLERVRATARKGALVLLPTHKSHVDYLVLSDVLHSNGVCAPLIAAGDNLSFWPLGPILRRGGGFFIRRSFRGSPLYPALVDAYLRKMLVEGFALEFFLEGGRSRTGKLLPPKYGLLSMVIDAAVRLHSRRVFFVPVSICYDRIIEQRSYARELSGAEKTKEDFGKLLRTPRILQSKYGRLYVEFGQTIELAEVAKDVTGATERGLDSLRPEDRRILTQRVAHRAVYEMNRATVVTPTALVAITLLGHRRRGMRFTDLATVAQSELDRLDQLGARIAPLLRDESRHVRPEALEEAVELFSRGRIVTRMGEGHDSVCSVPDERRIALEYYKNTIIHFFVPFGLIAAALRDRREETTSLHVVRERVRQLSRLLKYEFMYRADAPFDAIFTDALDEMVRSGLLERLADHVRPARDGAGVDVFERDANRLTTYFESYRLCVRAAGSMLAGGPIPRKEWIRETLALGEDLFLTGDVLLRESVSKSRIENAILTLTDHGLVRTGADGALELSEGVASAAALHEFEAKLAALCRPS